LLTFLFSPLDGSGGDEQAARSSRRQTLVGISFFDYALRQSYGVEGNLRKSPQDMGSGDHGVFFSFPLCFTSYFSLDAEIEMLRGVGE
jgi:hypothetical protein